MKNGRKNLKKKKKPSSDIHRLVKREEKEKWDMLVHVDPITCKEEKSNVTKRAVIFTSLLFFILQL